MTKKIVALLIGIVFLNQAVSCWAEAKNLAHLFTGEEMKVYVKGFTNESDNKKVPVDLFKKEVEKAFANRRSVLFEVVSNPNAADLEVTGIIRQYQYADKGPIKIKPGVGIMALDMMASMDGNYADMNVHFIIMDMKTKKILWEEDVYDYSKKKMTEDGSYKIVFDKVARKFVARSFSKPRR